MNRRLSPDADCEVELRVGERLLIELVENPATGFQWAVEGDPDFAGRIEQGAFEGAAALPGSSGLRVFAIVPDRPGRGRIPFVLRRQWESGPPRRRVRITIIASDDDEQEGEAI